MVSELTTSSNGHLLEVVGWSNSNIECKTLYITGISIFEKQVSKALHPLEYNYLNPFGITLKEEGIFNLKPWEEFKGVSS